MDWLWLWFAALIVAWAWWPEAFMRFWGRVVAVNRVAVGWIIDRLRPVYRLLRRPL